MRKLTSIHSILWNRRHFRYKKWLNKSKVTDRELPDSRRNRADDSVQDDEMSSAQAKPRTNNCSIDSFLIVFLF